MFDMRFYSTHWMKKNVVHKNSIHNWFHIFFFQGINFNQPHPRQRGRQPVTNPTLFGGFTDEEQQPQQQPPKSSPALALERPSRPVKPEPVYKKPEFKDTPNPVNFYPSTVSPVIKSTISYDPFNFQASPKEATPQERRDENIYSEEIQEIQSNIKESILSVTPNSLLDNDEGSTILPVFVTSEYPELRRVPKDAQSVGGIPLPSENEIEPRLVQFNNCEIFWLLKR